MIEVIDGTDPVLPDGWYEDKKETEVTVRTDDGVYEVRQSRIYDGYITISASERMFDCTTWIRAGEVSETTPGQSAVLTVVSSVGPNRYAMTHLIVPWSVVLYVKQRMGTMS